MKATVTAHRDYAIASIDDRVYGAFLEHLGRLRLVRDVPADGPAGQAAGGP